MDKSKWEYKKLGEVCEKGSSNIAQNKIEDNTGDYALYGASGYVKSIDFYHQEQPYIGVVKDGSGVGRVNKYPAKSSLLGTMQYIYPKNGCDLGYLLYVLQGLHLEKYKTGAAIPHIYFKDYCKCEVPFPSLLDQQRIVAELDCLNEMIALKQEQLKEFDKLAQSIFYDMFGDPVTNDKGWNMNTIGDVASFYNGKAHENDIDENGEFILVNAKFVASDGIILKRTNKQLFPLYENDIVMVMSDVPNGKALARCYLIMHNNKYSLNQRICVFRDYSLNSTFLLFLLNRNKYYLRFDNGNGQTNLRKNDVLECPVILPPLALQQQFAEKIKAIEVQKELVKKSIAETQQLLDSRMDYYFD